MLFLRSLLLLVVLPLVCPAAQTVLVLTTGGKWVEGVTSASKAGAYPLARVLSLHNGAAATETEAAAIASALAAVGGKERGARDAAIEELVAIGLPVVTPLLETIKDTDQHEPKPLYNLFGRLIPAVADGLDRGASLIRLVGQEPQRGAWPEGELLVGGERIAWAKIRMLAVRQKLVVRTDAVHSLRHSTQIECWDSGVRATAGSKLTLTARGFARLSWKQDDWATGPNGLTKPAGNYKTNLVDGHPFGALLGRVTAGGKWMFLGGRASVGGVGAGRLYLAVNDNAHWQNNLGSYVVSLSVTDAYDLGGAQ